MAIYGQVASATNSFSNNKKIKLLSANVADARVFTKASVSKMKQEEFVGKKYGKEYTLTIPGKPKVVNGVVADPSDIVEVETKIYLDNDNVSTTLGAWQRLGDLESFESEIGSPWAVTLGRSQEKKIVENNIFKALGAVVVPVSGGAIGADYSSLGKATAKLRKLAISSALVGFLDPDIQSEISDKAISNKFINSDAVFNKLYGENAIGKYANAGWVECPDLPTITTPASAATATITLSAIQDSGSNTIGFEPVAEITGTNLYKGAVFTVTGLKMVDTSGIQTEVPVQIVVLSANAAGTKGVISELRITIDGKQTGNPNAWVAAGTSTLTLTSALKTSTSYLMGQVRTKDCFAYDTYKFQNIPGGENREVASVGGTTLQMRIFGDGTNLDELVRIDSAYAAGIFEPREAVALYFELP